MPIWLNDSFLHNINMVSFKKKIKMEIMTYTFFFSIHSLKHYEPSNSEYGIYKTIYKLLNSFI